MSESKKTKTRTMRASDLVFTAGELKFAEGEGEGEGDGQHTPVELVVRTNSRVLSFMGPIIHDHNGVFFKDRIPLDWVHGGEKPQEILGFLDKVETSDKEIKCFGQIVSVKPDDIADHVVKQMKAGIPFESSIYFGGQGLVVEEVSEETEVEVNGGKFEGPGIVVRKWPLRGVAVCPHGADNQTSTSLALGEEEVSVSFVTNYNHRELDMAEENGLSPEELKAKEIEDAKLKAKEAKELEAKEAAELKAKEEEEAKLAKEQVKTGLVSSDGRLGMDFIKAFGSDGAVWFTEGKSFAEASVLYTQGLEKRVKELEERIKAANLGGDEAVSFQDDEKNVTEAKAQEKVTELTTKIGPRLAQFAAAMDLRK